MSRFFPAMFWGNSGMHMWSKNGTRTPHLPQPIEISQGQKQDIGKPCGVRISGTPTRDAPC